MHKSGFFWCVCRCPAQQQSGWKNNLIKVSNKQKILPTVSIVGRCSAPDCCSVLQYLKNAERKLQLCASTHLHAGAALLASRNADQIFASTLKNGSSRVWLMLFRAVLTNHGWRKKQPDFCQKRRILGRRGCPSRNPTQPWPCCAPRYCKTVKQSSAAFEKLPDFLWREKPLLTAPSTFWSFCLTCFPYLWNIFSPHPSFFPPSPRTKCNKEKPEHWKIMIRTTAFSVQCQRSDAVFWLAGIAACLTAGPLTPHS